MWWYWLQLNLLSCPFKNITGIECPGCGFQRSLMMLIKGDLWGSLELYPATVPVILILLTTLGSQVFNYRKLENGNQTLVIATALLIILSYLLKILNTY